MDLDDLQYEDWEEMFNRLGEYRLNVKYYSSTYSISIEELYYHFKQRMADEKEVSL